MDTSLGSKPGPLCHKCPLNSSKGPVWGKGPTTAKLVIIGQNPGPDEITAGAPFVGGAGRILNRALIIAGIERSQCFVTNAVKCYVPPKVPLPKGAVECCRPLLDKELEDMREASTYLTLGAPAFYTFSGKSLTTTTNKKNPDAWLRGAPYPISRTKTVIPAVHPVYLAYTGFKDEPYFIRDLQRAFRFAWGGARIPDEHFNYHPTRAEVEEYVQEILNTGEYGADIETPMVDLEEDEELAAGGEPTEIEVIGLSARKGEAIGVPPDLFDLLPPIFDPPRPLVVHAFNWGFDGYHLGTHYRFGENLIPADLMLALNHLYSDIRPKDLGMALSLFTDIPYHKNLMRINPTVYNGRDTYGALWGGQVAIKEMELYGKLKHLFDTASMPLISLVRDIRVYGANCDIVLAQRIELACMKTLAKYQALWRNIAPHTEWTSPKQLIEMFTRMKLPLIYRNRGKDGKKTPTVDDDALKEYIEKYGIETAKLILEMRKLKKAADFTHIYHKDGRAHIKYKIHGQRGGRLQAKDPDIQNLPESLAGINPRSIIIPDSEDHIILHADFEQIELWCYAYASQDEHLLEIKRRGDYVYGIFYEEIFQEPFFYEGKPKMKPYRRKDVSPSKLLIAKSGPLGFIYGRGPNSLIGPPMNLRKKDAYKAHDTFHEKHPKVQRLHSRLRQEVEAKGYLQNYFGRIRRFPNPKGAIGDILSFPGQSNGADILIQNALLPLHRGLKDYGARLLFTVHDSITVSCPRQTALGCGAFIRECMEAPIPQMGNFWIPIALYVGEKNWGELQSYEEYEIAQRASTGV